MKKKSKSVIKLFTESVGLYFSQFDKFIKYMTFPVIGQILGLVIIFITAYCYSLNIPKLIDKYPNLNDFGTIILLLALITLPGLIIFCKAFWDYLVAYGAVNSMYINLQKSGKLYDYDAHNELIKRQSFKFICLWILLSVYSLISLCPLLWVICGILAVYFVLLFQVFTFEPEKSSLGCFKKSIELIKGNFGKTFALLVLSFLLSYILIPQLVINVFNGIGISQAISNFIMPYFKTIPELDFSQYGLGFISHSDYAIITTQAIIAQILIQYTLPFRSILWAGWYKELNSGIIEPEIHHKTKSKSKKRPSEKLMEASKKNFSKKKIDSNILKRAMEKDEE